MSHNSGQREATVRHSALSAGCLHAPDVPIVKPTTDAPDLVAEVRDRLGEFLDALTLMLREATNPTPTSTLDALLTSDEVADYLKVPVATIYEWRSRNNGPRGVKLGKHVRYRRRDVEAWLDQTTAAQSPAPAARPRSHVFRNVSG